MRSLTLLATEIYQTLGNYSNLTERKEATRQYILTEITQWGIKKQKLNQGAVLIFKPKEFKPSENSLPFEVSLEYNGYEDIWELTFGNLEAWTDEEQYKWDDKDPNRLPKALFLQKVLTTEVLPFLRKDTSGGIKFVPYNEDGHGADRLSYFQNMFRKLDSSEFQLNQGDDAWYIIRK
jgi:hypothetical protein